MPMRQFNTDCHHAVPLSTTIPPFISIDHGSKSKKKDTPADCMASQPVCSLRAYICSHAYVCMHIQSDTHTCMYGTWMHICAYTYMYAHIHTPTSVYQNTDPGHHDPVYRIYIENLSNIGRPPIDHLSIVYRTYIDRRSNTYRLSNHRSPYVPRRESRSEINIDISWTT